MQVNPFTNRSTIIAADDFFGRHEIVASLLARLVHVAKPQCVSLVGQRRIGKSSLFRHLAQVVAERAPNTKVFYYDLEAARDLSVERFFAKLVRRFGGRRPVETVDDGLSSFEQLEELLEAGESDGGRYILALDEFDTVTLNPAFDASFFGSLRYLTSNYPLAFLTSSYDDLALLCHADEIRQSPFFNVFTSMALGVMPAAEVDELLSVLILRGGIDFTDAERAWVIEQGGCFPFFVQMASAAVWEEKQMGRPGVSDRTRAQLVDGAAPHFRYFVDHLSGPERDALTTVVNGLDPPEPLLRRLESRSLVRRVGAKVAPFSPSFARFAEECSQARSLSRSDRSFQDESTESFHDLGPGMIVGQRFQIERELGRGGFGRVFRAVDTVLRRAVAIKCFLRTETSDDATQLAHKSRALKEARAVAHLSHPSIVTVFDVLDWNGQVLIAMELIEGETLSQSLRSRGPLPMSKAAAIALDVLRALHHAHGNGIVHRDIKPGNIMVDSQGRVRVMDFGLVRLTESDSVSGATPRCVGTPSYMAPEQMSSHRVDHRADLYALGVLLFELVAGRLPFRGASIPEVMYQVVHAAPPPLHTIVPDIDPRYAAMTMRCLAKTPDERPSTPDLLAQLSGLAAIGTADHGDPALSQRDTLERPAPER